MAVAEAIVICVDDSRWLSSRQRLQTQYDAIKHYCEAKFQEHEDTVVTVHTLGSSRPRLLIHPPTRSLTEILDSVQRCYPGYGGVNLVRALTNARLPLISFFGLPDKKTRILFFIGALTNLSSEDAQDFGKRFRDQGIAVDIVNFETPEDEDTIRHYDYPYGRSQLYQFFNICNFDDNSHFVDVEPGSSDICQLISDSMLKNTPCLSEKRNDNVKELEPSRKRSRRQRRRR